MSNLYLTLGSDSVLDAIITQNPKHDLYLMKPQAALSPNSQLLEISNHKSIFKAPITYAIRYQSQPAPIRTINHFMYFNFNVDEDQALWQRLRNFAELTNHENHSSFLAVRAGVRKQYLLYTSWDALSDWQAFQKLPDFATIDALKNRSAKDWSFYESRYVIEPN